MIPMNDDGTRARVSVSLSAAAGQRAFTFGAFLNPMLWSLRYVSEELDERVTIRQFLGFTLTTLRIGEQ